MKQRVDGVQLQMCAAVTLFASRRRLLGCESLQWGAWAGVGMAVDSGVVEQLEQQGMGAVLEDQGKLALELATRGNKAVVGAIPLMWPVLLGLLEGDVPSFLSVFEGQAAPQMQACL